jgi:hypothetical protein
MSVFKNQECLQCDQMDVKEKMITVKYSFILKDSIDEIHKLIKDRVMPIKEETLSTTRSIPVSPKLSTKCKIVW